MHWPPLPPGRNMSIKNSNDTIRSRSRDLPVGSAVPQPTAPPRVPLETCRGPQTLIIWIKSATRWFYCTDILRCTVSKTLHLIRFVVITYTHSEMLLKGVITNNTAFYITHICIFLQSIHSLIHALNKAKFITVSNCYMFRHLGAILRESSRTQNTSPAR
jgi:hypothetical protein